MGSAGQTRRLTIDIEVASEPISGKLSVGGKQTEMFVGWTALAELLEEARTGTPSTGAKTGVSESGNGGE